MTNFVPNKNKFCVYNANPKFWESFMILQCKAVVRSVNFCSVGFAFLHSATWCLLTCDNFDHLHKMMTVTWNIELPYSKLAASSCPSQLLKKLSRKFENGPSTFKKCVNFAYAIWTCSLIEFAARKSCNNCFGHFLCTVATNRAKIHFAMGMTPEYDYLFKLLLIGRNLRDHDDHDDHDDKTWGY